jgi:hypothetical protein
MIKEQCCHRVAANNVKKNTEAGAKTTRYECYDSDKDYKGSMLRLPM